MLVYRGVPPENLGRSAGRQRRSATGRQLMQVKLAQVAPETQVPVILAAMDPYRRRISIYLNNSCIYIYILCMYIYIYICMFNMLYVYSIYIYIFIDR